MALFDATLGDQDADMAVRDVLRRRLKLSRTLYRRLWRDGEVLLDGRSANPFEPVSAGQRLTLELAERPSRVEAEAMNLAIAYEDDFVAVVDKPAGVVVHPTGGVVSGTLAAGLAARYGTFHLISRLDQETSGLLVVALDPLSAQRLALAQQRRELSRLYRAVAHGLLAASAGTLTAPIARRPGLAYRIVADDGQAAITHYTVALRERSEKTAPDSEPCPQYGSDRIASGQYEAHGDPLPGRTWLELRLETGRTHQIRVHLSHLGHPLLGDDRYGPAPRQHPRLCLHAAEVRFTHPRTGQSIALRSSWPEDLPPPPPDLASWQSCNGLCLTAHLTEEPNRFG